MRAAEFAIAISGFGGLESIDIDVLDQLFDAAVRINAQDAVAYDAADPQAACPRTAACGSAAS